MSVDQIYHVLSGALHARVVSKQSTEALPAGAVVKPINSTKELLAALKQVNAPAPEAQAAAAAAGQKGQATGLRAVIHAAGGEEQSFLVYVNAQTITVAMLRGMILAQTGLHPADVDTLRRGFEIGLALPDTKVLADLNLVEGEEWMLNLHDGVALPAAAAAAAQQFAAPPSPGPAGHPQQQPETVYVIDDDAVFNHDGTCLFEESDYVPGMIQGGLPYHRPINWLRIGLNVKDYFGEWLGRANIDGEWAIGYQGFKQVPMPGLDLLKLKVGKVSRGALRLFTDIEQLVAECPEECTTGPQVNQDGIDHRGKMPQHRLVLMCRAHPLAAIRNAKGELCAAAPSRIRPYGLLIPIQ